MVFGHSPDDKRTRIHLPSREKKIASGAARATIWVVAVGGRIDKLLLNAGRAFHTFKAKRCKCLFFARKKSNACHQHSKKASTTACSAVPGQRVGLIASHRTGVFHGTVKVKEF